MKHFILLSLALFLCIGFISAVGCNGTEEQPEPKTPSANTTTLPPGQEGVLADDEP